MQVVTRGRAQSGHVTQMSQYSETKRVTRCGWRHAPEARRDLWRFEKLESQVLDVKTRRIDFWSSQGRGELAPYGGGRSRWGPNEYDSIEDCVSPPYVETFNSKLIKGFRNWTRNRYVFSNSEIPLFYRYEHYISISRIALIVNMVIIYLSLLIYPNFWLSPEVSSLTFPVF